MRPLPTPSELTRPFWDAAREHRLVRQVCRDCRTSFFSPQIACPACLSEAYDWVPSSGRGEIYSCTVVHRAPSPGFDVPYVFAIVDLEDGWSMLANVVGCEVAEATIGLPVRVTFLDFDEITLPAFEPTGR